MCLEKVMSKPPPTRFRVALPSFYCTARMYPVTAFLSIHLLFSFYDQHFCEGTIEDQFVVTLESPEPGGRYRLDVCRGLHS